MKSENFQALTSELTQLTPHQRSILSDRLREIEHASVSRTLIEERLSNKPLCPRCGGFFVVIDDNNRGFSHSLRLAYC